LLGHYGDNKKNFYQIEREFSYDSNSLLRTDIMIQKLLKTATENHEQVFIEAKRVNEFEINFSENSYKFKHNNVKNIRIDIEKLRKEWEYRKGILKRKIITDKFRPCLLLWGIYEAKHNYFLAPNDLVTALKEYENSELKKLSKKTLRVYKETKWYPLIWSNSDRNKPSNPTRWVWINLIELDF